MNPSAITLQALPENTILKGQYLVEACIGSGGFGVTYRAKNLKAEADTVAIKEFFPRAAVERGERGRVRVRPGADREFQRWQENYEREYSLLSQLRDNRAILRVRETFRENNTSYLVMDFIPGATLDARVRGGGPLTGQEVMDLMRPFLPELQKMHRAGILHRDINPGNVMLPPGDMPKLIDFGSARPVPRPGDRLTVQLNPGFAPPEQYDSKAMQGPETDVYGLCASLYFALTGVIPPDALSRRANDALSPVANLCDVPERLARAVMRGLSLDAALRPSGFDALWHDIFDGAEAAAPPPHTASRPPQPKAAGPNPGGIHMSRRLDAARRATAYLARLMPRRYRDLANELDAIARAPASATQRVILEERILAQGRAFSVLCALLTRKGA